MINKKSNFVVIGAGGHAKVILATLLTLEINLAGILDDNSSLWGKTILGCPILGPINKLNDFTAPSAVIGIGNNEIRKKIANQYSAVNWETIIHPRAFVDSSAIVGKGSVIFAGAIIQPEVKIGEHCIINTGATIDHDCVLGNYTHICPGVHLAGDVYIDEGCMLGVASSVIQGIRIGAWSIVGGGSIVIEHLPEKVTAFGIPAKQKEVMMPHSQTITGV